MANFELSPLRVAGPYAVSGNYTVKPQGLSIQFEVKKDPAIPWRVNKAFSEKHYRNWELWEWDVVEIFLQVRTQNNPSQEYPYWEFQLSPLNQPLALGFKAPRLGGFTPLEFPLQHHCLECNDHSWKCEVLLPWPLPLPGSKSYQGKTEYEIAGNFCACLGGKREGQESAERYFFSQNWPTPNKDIFDFHHPKNFVPLKL